MVAEEAAKREGLLLAPNSQELLPISFQTERKKKRATLCGSLYSCGVTPYIQLREFSFLAAVEMFRLLQITSGICMSLQPQLHIKWH